MAETTVTRHLCSVFRGVGKAMGQVYQCWWRIGREINVFFFRSEYHIPFYVLYPSVIYLLTLLRVINVGAEVHRYLHASARYFCSISTEVVLYRIILLKFPSNIKFMNIFRSAL
jgi:hypothetical protein